MLQQPLRQTAYSSESVLTTVPHLPSHLDSFLLGVSVSPTKLCCSNKQSPNLRGIQQQGCMSHSSFILPGVCRLLQLCSVCPFHSGTWAEGAASIWEMFFLWQSPQDDFKFSESATCPLHSLFFFTKASHMAFVVRDSEEWGISQRSC